MARALITGIGGQDGSYLAEQLLADGHEVFGTLLGSPDDYPALDAVRDRIRVVDDADRALADLEPDELYHLAAVSVVPAWWDDPVGLTRAEYDEVATARYQARVLEDLARMLDEDVIAHGKKADEALTGETDPVVRARVLTNALTAGSLFSASQSSIVAAFACLSERV